MPRGRTVGAEERGGVRADLLYFSARAGVLVCDHGSVHLVRVETFRVAPDDVTVEAGGEGGAEAGGGAGAGLLEEGRDGRGVGEDVAWEAGWWLTYIVRASRCSWETHLRRSFQAGRRDPPNLAVACGILVRVTSR